jgi:S1-C subfamily serine protease
VRFGEGDAVQARLRGRDPSSDLALLQVDPADIPSGVRPVELATSEGLRPGDAAIAIGSPFGLAGTVTTGIISALDREIPAPNGFTISGVLQTDAAINPGNSGGPLLDARGRAIGVNSQIATGGGNQSSGVGFAVPIDTVREVVPALKEGGVVERAWLGVSTADDPSGAGAVIRGVVAGGPADEAGLRPGDVIVGIAGDAVRDPGDVGTEVNERDPGEEVQVRVRRDDEETDVVVRLGERPQANPAG